MKALNKKLRSQRGETLIEVLASILITTLSVALLLGGVAVSASLGRQADMSDQSFYEALTAAEQRQTPIANQSVTVTEGGASVQIPVQVYGGQGLYSYALDTAGGAGT